MLSPANVRQSFGLLGCGTTIDAAEKLGRDWIDMDVTQLAISLIKYRLQDTYGRRLKFESRSRREEAQTSPPENGQSLVTSTPTEMGIPKQIQPRRGGMVLAETLPYPCQQVLTSLFREQGGGEVQSRHLCRP